MVLICRHFSFIISYSKTFGQAIIVAGGMGVHQNNLDSVEILRMDKGAVVSEVNIPIYYCGS